MNTKWIERRKPRQNVKADGRDDYDVDYARVIHSSSFRRLQGKTQIHQCDSDVPRTRLTHSIEVSQIALGIAQRIKAKYGEDSPAQLVSSHSLVQVVGLCHDLGHPCGGHAGEEALNACLPYEGNGQTLRILSRLESHTSGFGSNLTRRTLLGILKYPIAYTDAANGRTTPPPHRGLSGVPLIGAEHKPPKCYLDEEKEVVDWLLAPFETEREIVERELIKSFDASLMDIADDFAYSAADLDDAIALGMMKREWIYDDVPADLWRGFIENQASSNRESRRLTNAAEVIDALMGSSQQRRHQTGSIINYLLSGIEVLEDSRMTDPLYRYRVKLGVEQKALVDALKACVYERVINSSTVQADRARIQRQIVEVYDAMTYKPLQFLPEKHRELYLQSDENPRIIADYIAGMTDRFLCKTHSAIFG